MILLLNRAVNLRTNDNATFNGNNLTVEWIWKTIDAKEQCDLLQGIIKKRREFKKKVEHQIKEGILMSWTGKVEDELPLMELVQPTN